MHSIAVSEHIFVPHQCKVCLSLKLGQELKGEFTETFEPETELHACAGCGLVFYCSQKHRSLDWKVHRDLCMALQDIKHRFNVSHPYLLCDQPKEAFAFERAIYQVKYLLRTSLKRPLNNLEDDQTSFPVHCAVCYSFKDIKPCQQCWSVGYCSKDHATRHSAKHLLICGLLQNYHTRFKVVALPQPEIIVKKIYKFMENLIEVDLIDTFQYVTEMKLPVCPTQSLKDYQLYSCAANFSCIGTICFTLAHCFIPSYLQDNDKFIIFIIGATKEHDLWFSEIHTQFFFLHFPIIAHLEVYFFGPEVSSDEPRTLSYTLGGISRFVTYQGFKGRLETFYKSYNIKPSIIAGFNCGFTNVSPKETFVTKTVIEEEPEEDDGPVRNEWIETLSAIIQTYHTPILFTSFTSLEAEYDFEAISHVASTDQSVAKLERIFEVKENPYRDFRPLRNWQAIHGAEIYYRNGHVQAVVSSLE